MTPQEALVQLAIAAVGYAVVAAAYVVLAWVLGRRFGARALSAAWLLASVGMAAMILVRTHLRMTRHGTTVPPTWERGLAVGILGMLLLAFGLATLSVRKRLKREPAVALGVGGVARGVGAFFVGIGMVMAVFLIADVRHIMTE